MRWNSIDCTIKNLLQINNGNAVHSWRTHRALVDFIIFHAFLARIHVMAVIERDAHFFLAADFAQQRVVRRFIDARIAALVDSFSHENVHIHQVFARVSAYRAYVRVEFFGALVARDHVTTRPEAHFQRLFGANFTQQNIRHVFVLDIDQNTRHWKRQFVTSNTAV